MDNGVGNKNTAQSGGLKNLILPLFCILTITGSFLVGIRIGKGQEADQLLTTVPTPAISRINPTTVPAQQPTGWKTARFGGLFSYDYPAGWHVAELWQENYAENGITIAIDPDPINTAPRGGPLSTFAISVLNGNKNPDEILAKKIDSFSPANYTDITQETISADIGKIYHYSGKIAGEMLKGQPVENYYFTFNQNPADPLNQQVIVASMQLKEDPQLSEMLRHIVLSFRNLQQ